MKNLAKFFVAVAALFVGVSCTTDTTEDLGQQIVGKGQTVLTVSTGESVLDTKTSLGGKVDGTYPIYWSNGDQLSLNGVASAPLADVEENATTASFTWEGTFDAPFCVAYPASKEGTVTFAAEQEYVEGTFSQNAVPMIGYADEAGVSSVKLEYLAGVLQFNVSGAATLASMIIETVDGTPIAGVFDCDFATGTVKPQAGSRSSIEYSFGEEGLNISGGKSFHVAVPAGKYEAVKVIMLDAEGGAFEGTLKADGTNKPELAAGQVREFTISNWSANKTYTVIKDAQTLEQFAEAVAETPDLQAVVLKDVDASSIAATWAPIEGFTGLLRGNGKTISGLTKPLFGELKGTVTNLTLNSEVVSGDTTDGSMNKLGIFAKTLIGTSTTEGEGETAVTTVAHAQLISCTAKGSLTINNTTEANTTSSAVFCFGGLVGLARDAKIKGCANEAVVTSTKYAKASAQGKPYLGGVAGLVYTTEMKNCVNKALVDWNDTTSAKYQTCPHIGGVVGYIESGSTFSGNKNYGEVKLQKSIRTGGIGGVVGTTEVNVTDCVNYGVLNIGSTNGEHRYTDGWGGVVGKASAALTISGCANHGAINFTANFGNMCLGGILGSSQKDRPNNAITTNATYYAVNMSNCDNYGPITISGNKITVGSNTSVGGVIYGYFFVGGIASYTTGTISNVHNHKSATITINGGGVLDHGVNRGTNPIETYPQTCWAGVMGRKTSSGGTMYNDADIIIGGTWTVQSVPAAWSVTSNGKTTNYTTDPAKHTADVFIGGIYANGTCSVGASINNGNITINDTASFDCGLFVGGIIGRGTSDQSGMTNHGNITYSGTKCSKLKIGGITGYHTGTLTSVTNNGNISYSGAGCSTLYIAGISGHHSKALTSGSNTGTITVNGSFDFPTDGVYNFNAAGITGYAGATISNTTNEGEINISSELVVPSTATYGQFGIGGISARAVVSLTNVTNSGDITVSSNFAAVPTTTTGEGDAATTKNNYTMHPIFIGGLVGWAGKATYDGAYNSGKITVSGTHSYTSGTLHVSGVYCRGSNNTASTYSGCENTGAIKVSAISENGNISIAGVSSHSTQGTLKDSFNNAPIEFTGQCKVLNIAGVSTGSSAAGSVFDNCDNKAKGTITVNGTIDGDAESYVGGIMSNMGYNVTIKNCENEAAINFTNKTSQDNMCIGGLLGRIAGKTTVQDCANNGAITTADPVKYFSGGFGFVEVTADWDISTWTNIKNTATITYPKTRSSEVLYIGGVAGRVDGAVGTIKQWHNEGDIKVGVDATKVINKRGFVGGVVGLSSVKNFSYCSNTGDVIAPYTFRTDTSGKGPDVASWVGLLSGVRYYHTGAEGVDETVTVSNVDNCLVKGTIKRYNISSQTVDECVVDTVEEVYKYAFAEPESMEGDQDPTLFMTNISVTTMPQEPAQE